MEVRKAGLARLVAATRAHDAAAIERMLQTPVGFGGLWFADTACRDALANGGTLQAAGVPAFARCLAPVTFESSPRGGMIPEVGAVVYGSGFEAELQFAGTSNDPKITWIGHVGRRDAKDALPTISVAAFEALREGQRADLDASARAALQSALEKSKHVSSMFKVCLDASGAISGVHPRYTTSLAAQDVFEAEIKRWTFHPFSIDGQPMPVCAVVGMTYPDDPAWGAQAALPIPLPAKHTDALLAPPGKLVAGDRSLMPAGMLHDQLRQRAREPGEAIRYSVMYDYCVDARGAVDYVAILRTSGNEALDRHVVRKVSEWRFEPVVYRGQAIAVCTIDTYLIEMQ